MRRRLLALTSLLIVLLLVGAGSVYAFDQGRKDVIAEGITVNGVAVGGMSVPAAKAKLRRTLLEPLERDVVVRGAGRRFVLHSERASIGLDVDGSVARALAASRDGGLLARTWRALRGGAVDEDVHADVNWSRKAVGRLVDRVQRAIDEPARDASLDLSGGDVNPTPSKQGVRVRSGWLSNTVRRTLLSTAPERDVVHARTDAVEPEVSTEDLAEKYPAVLVLNRSAFQLTLYEDLERAKTYSVAVGMVGLETPAGLYHIQNKAVNPAWTKPNSDWVAEDERGEVVPGGTAENPLKARWMGIFDGAGIHGIDPGEYGTIGHAASHGCVRMRIPDVIELYDQVPVGAPIYIG